MASEETSPSPSHHRPSIKSSVSYSAADKRRQQAVSISRERRDALIRAKRLCRDSFDKNEARKDSLEGEMVIDDEKSVLDSKTIETVKDLKSALSNQGKNAMQKTIEILRKLRKLLAQSEIPPIEAAIQAGAIQVLVECLSFGSPDEQLHESAWCLTNIAAGGTDETKSLVPALPLLIAHLGEKSSARVKEQCAWALGNVAGEDSELRNILISQNAISPLVRLFLSDERLATRTAAWALSNLIKGPDSKAANELVKIEGVLDLIVNHLKTADDELATEVAWVVVYLSALSDKSINVLIKSETIPVLISRLVSSDNLQLLIPVLRSLGNLIAADARVTEAILIVGNNITDQLLLGLIKCLKSELRVLQKESLWVLSNIAAGSTNHKTLIFSSEAIPLLLNILSSSSPFEIRREAAYTLGNICVSENVILTNHLVPLVQSGCLSGFVNLVKSADLESAKVGLQFIELVMRGYPNGEGPKFVEREDGIDAMERFQFHENVELRNMANALIDKYFGENYGLE